MIDKTNKTNFSWGKSISVWWSISWRTTVIGLIITCLAACVCIFFMPAREITITNIDDMVIIIGNIVSIPAAILATKQALEVHFSPTNNQ